MKRILIVGAKSDIAKAIARKYALNGYDLYLAARGVDELEPFANDVNIRTQKDVKLVELDILDFQSHQSIINELADTLLGVIVLAGYLGEQVKAQTEFEEARKIVDTNYTGLVSFLNIIANQFEKKGSGFIVGVSSVAGDRGRKTNYIYGSAKAALTAYLSGMRNRLYEHNVKVLTVKPGFVYTKMTEGMDLPEKLTAHPEEVADAIFKAQQKGRDVLYSKWIWRYIMVVIRSIPEWIFKKMSI